jgi:guanylate kinase
MPRSKRLPFAPNATAVEMAQLRWREPRLPVAASKVTARDLDVEDFALGAQLRHNKPDSYLVTLTPEQKQGLRRRALAAGLSAEETLQRFLESALAELEAEQ